MGKSREIKTRIKAVKNIQRITRTMQMIATSKFSKAQQAATSSKPYTEGLFDLVAQLASAAGDIEHPLLETQGSAMPELTLVITSDRGLCGPYNANIIRTALNHFRGNSAAMTGPVEVVGKKGLTPLRFNGVEISTHHTQFGDKPRYEDVNELAERYMDLFARGEISAVRVVSMKYYSAGRQAPEVTQVLPFSSDALEQADAFVRERYSYCHDQSAHANPKVVLVQPYPGEGLHYKIRTVEECKADCLAAGVAVCGAFSIFTPSLVPPGPGTGACYMYTITPGTSVRSEGCYWNSEHDTYVVKGVWDGTATVRRRQLTATVAPPPRPPPPVSRRRLSLPPSMYGGNAPNGKCYMELPGHWQECQTRDDGVGLDFYTAGPVTTEYDCSEYYQHLIENGVETSFLGFRVESESNQPAGCTVRRPTQVTVASPSGVSNRGGSCPALANFTTPVRGSKMPPTMVTNMPRAAVSQISRLTRARRRPGDNTALPRQRYRLAVLAISKAAFMPLPETSPRQKQTRPSSNGK